MSGTLLKLSIPALENMKKVSGHGLQSGQWPGVTPLKKVVSEARKITGKQINVEDKTQAGWRPSHFC